VIELRSLRYFVAVAEELHFGRAAARVFVAQQVLSREIARFEHELGVRLFDRTTRRVELTRDGEWLLPRARQVLVLVDEIVETTRGDQRDLVVDVIRYGSTAARVLERARLTEEHMSARFHGGFAAAFNALLAGRVDVAFGRPGSARTDLKPAFSRQLVRLEPLGLMVPDDHSYASQPVIGTAAIRGSMIDTSAGNVDAVEWVELATELVEHFGGTPSPDHHPGMSAVAAAPVDDVARHVRETGWPLLTMLDLPAVPGATVLPLVDPTPIYPWVMTHRRDVRHAGLRALRDAVKLLSAENRWLDVPASAWFATGDQQLVAELSN
jgi:DNA-binding transcriptional LysR family regulator